MEKALPRRGNDWHFRAMEGGMLAFHRLTLGFKP